MKTEKHSDNHGNLRGVFMIVFSMLATGFALGMLLAPKSGKELRKDILEKMKDWVDRGKFTLMEARVKGEELLEKSKENIEKASAKAVKKTSKKKAN